MLQTVNAAVLVWLLARFLFKPIANIIVARQDAARALLTDAEALKRAAIEDREAVLETRQALEASRERAIQAIDAQAGAEKTALLKAAQAEIAQMHSAAQAQIARDASAHWRQVQASATLLAADIAEKLLARLPRESKITGFADGLAGALAALPPAARDALATAGSPLTLCLPRKPTDSEQASILETLSRAAGHPLLIEVTIDPSLIAGLELRGPHIVVSNHLRHDLDEIRASLADTDAKTASV
ncbi:F0F1 ATP synthase subunit B [Trinickia dinghuensis]|uniref:F0F1 ATP synthase subunit B n=1 Tax=Trinickia dinghuensis TaxID=2291023 RepID=UPI001C6A695D|nr:F0F1 ATP synthase subunit B [Trinickia dinghuensis]